jgi:hypothetical protein
VTVPDNLLRFGTRPYVVARAVGLDWPSPAEAQRTLDAVLQAMRGGSDANALQRLAQAVQGLAGELTDAQAQQALGALLQAMRRTTDEFALQRLAQAVQALAAKLTDAQLDAVLLAMRGTTDAKALLGPSLALAVKAVAGKLTDAHAQQALDAVPLAMRGATEVDAFWSLVQAAQSLGGKVTDASHAQRALDAILQAMRGTTGAGMGLALAQAAQSLAGKLTDAQAQQVLATSHLQSAFGWSATTEESAEWAKVIVTLLRRPEERNYISAIVELLKYPVAGGQATNVLLEALRRAIPAAPGAEAGLRANLRWIADTYPGIDLKSAPACPPPLRDGLACPSEP